jgi:hypothetical protein
MSRLGDIALARSGDKGAHANVGVWTRSADAFEFLRRELTADRVAHHFRAFAPQAVERYELANIYAFNFVLRGVLGSAGAAGSVRTDAQAKTYAQGLLLLELDIPPALISAGR